MSRKVVVMGSGAAGLTAALAAARDGASVTLLEASGYIGGTTLYSGGMMWLPLNPLMAQVGKSDSLGSAKAYLDSFNMGRGSQERLDAYLVEGPRMVDFVVRESPLKLKAAPTFCDYRSELPGWCEGGRTVEPSPVPGSVLPGSAPPIRPSPQYPGRLTYEEMIRTGWVYNPAGDGAALHEQRERDDLRTLGFGLVTGLLAGCLEHGVKVRLNARAIRPVIRSGAVVGVVVEGLDGQSRLGADAVILGCGGFEWDPELRRLLNGRVEGTMSPPSNRGDGLRIAMEAGALTGRTDEAWWCPVISPPGRTLEGNRVFRLSSQERGLPGTIMINRYGERFVNEAMNYNDVGRQMALTDPRDYRRGRPNSAAWLMFDSIVRQSYRLAGLAASDPDPDWLVRGETVAALADRIDVPRERLQHDARHLQRDGSRGRRRALR